jgi:anti-sigma B factor antagonist
MSDQAGPVTPVVVVLPPEIDVTNCDEVFEQLAEVLVPGVDTVIADMMGTSFCDSSGVHAIMRAYESAAARDITMRVAVSPDGSVHRVLELIGASRLMPVHPTLEDALSEA